MLSLTYRMYSLIPTDSKKPLMLYSYFLDKTKYRVTVDNFIHATITWSTTIYLVMVHETQCAEGNWTALETHIYKFRNFKGDISCRGIFKITATYPLNHYNLFLNNHNENILKETSRSFFSASIYMWYNLFLMTQAHQCKCQLLDYSITQWLLELLKDVATVLLFTNSSWTTFTNNVSCCLLPSCHLQATSILAKASKMPVVV